MNVINTLLQRACLGSAFALLVGQALMAPAQTVLIDFGSETTYRSLSVLNPDSNGTQISGWRLSISRSIVVPDRWAPTTKNGSLAVAVVSIRVP